MQDTAYRAIAIVGAGAVLPDAPNVTAFWKNITAGRYSITEVTPDRWDSALYYDPDHSAPDKTYSKIGGWVREYAWDPLKWRMAIPPRVADAMDQSQQWAITATRELLADYGYPERPLNTERTAVILGNAMGGEQHYLTSMRAYFPEYARELEESATFAALPAAVRRDITRDWHVRMGKRLPPITEDSMPGELANCLAGRIANLFNFRGPNFVCDAACASAMAAIHAAMEGLVERDFDVAITGGIDRNMGAPSFVKFCKIGALSATGSRPYAEGADGFVMGEGVALLLLKRLADAERDGDNIYAVIRGIGASSDGKGKGITAPNPVGQKLCLERAWQNAGVSPATATLIEGHGTSTSVGDVVEVESMATVLKDHGANGRPIALGSVKSNVGHLKGAAGAAGILKTALALRNKVMPPSVRCEHPNPNIDFAHSPLYVNTELRPWAETADGVRRAGASAFGFGGTNFHAVLEEHIPNRLNGNGKRSVAVCEAPSTGREPTAPEAPDAGHSGLNAGSTPAKAPLRGALVMGAATEADLVGRLRAVLQSAGMGQAPAIAAPSDADLLAAERIAIDYANAAELADKCGKALKAFASGQPVVWKALRPQGIFRGRGPAPKVAFLYTGQGSQYANMLRQLRADEPIVASTFEEADRVMTPLLGKPLSQYIFVDPADAAAVARAEEDLRQTAITQPAVLATDLSLTRLLAAYGVRPDMTMGHSLGEYGALVAAGALPFADALEAVSARGREMTRVSMADNGRMAAVFAPLKEVERILATIDGYVVIANINSDKQSVIGGASKAVQLAVEEFAKAGYNVVPLPVSHAFHTSIVAPASEPLRRTMERLGVQPGNLPVVANVNGEFYPAGPDARPAMLEILARQVASPVQFVKGLRTLFEAGARVFVEVGPKKALHGFVEDVLGDRPDVLALFTNHPKLEDATAFNQALCGLYAAGLGAQRLETRVEPDPHPAGRRPVFRPIVITGASLGLPGTERIFDDGNFARILRGQQFIEPIPTRWRHAILDKHITRLVKSENGGPTFEELHDPEEVIKLAARGGRFDLGAEFGVSAERIAALDRATSLAIGAGIDALRDAGIPLTMRYKSTSKGTYLPERWGLPDALRDDTGVIFASVFPGYNSFADEMERYYSDRSRRDRLAMLESLREGPAVRNGQPALRQEIDRLIAELQESIAKMPFHFDRRFLFRVLSMGHSQFAELIGARGPNTQINAACASSTQAVGLSQDWIRAGRCRRVIVISADDITSDHLIEWFGAGFLASGAAATDGVVEEAAVPFDRRRHGMIMGMGAAAMVLESAEAAEERGLQPICEVLGAVTANSAFHGTRLDVNHIHNVMEEVVRQAETCSGIRREQFAPSMVFVSHETYTPARGGSASAEVHALRTVFGDAADRIVIANTKGFTGHAMGTGIEDVVAVKALETGCVPPVANFKEVDPELGSLNLSKGGTYPVEYSLRLGAGFGSQISLTLMRRVGAAGTRPGPDALGYNYRISDPIAWQGWLDRVVNRPADLEVVHRTLRVRDTGVPANVVPAEEVAAPVAPAPVPQPKIETVPHEAVPVAGNGLVQERVLALVAEETGYPQEMLDLEADLGIDTVKQAAMSAAVPDTDGIPHDPNMKLRDFPTPANVQFVGDRQPEPQAAAPVPVAAPDDESVQEMVLNLVAEKTGYPKDMLDLDLDLEADLGIDTVKQAEMFAAVRERYNIPRDPNMKLRDFPTLASVMQFVRDRRPAPQAAAPVPVAAPDDESVQEMVLNLVAEKTGYPKDMLDLDLDLEADLGIDTVKQAEMFAAIRETYNIPRDPNMKLREFPTLASVMQFVRDRLPKPQAAAPVPVAAPVETAAPPARPEPQAEAPVPAAVPDSESVQETVLNLVAEKTGYPKDMLDLDLDLEADLGIDTVKQAEMFAAIRATYNIPRDPNMKLREFPTLASVMQFVRDRLPEPQAVAPVPVAAPVETAAPPARPEPQASAPVPVAVPDDESVQEMVLNLVAEKTGYPKDMLDLDLDLEADLGIDTVKQAEMFAAIRATYNIPRDPNMKLREFPTLASVMQFVRDRLPAPQAAAPVPVAAPVETAAPPEPQAAAPVPAAVPEDESVQEMVLNLVAEKTGYPKDMLDLDLDLEADLGIDTVKQAEMFAAIRATYNIPRDPNMKLREFPTLASVMQFVRDRLPKPQAEAPVPVAAPVETAAPPAADSVREMVLNLVAEKTGYPKDMLDPDLDLEADLGIDTVKQAEMFAAIRETYNIARDPNLKLRDFPTMADVIRFAEERGKTAAAMPAAEKQEPPRRPAPATFEAADKIPRRVPIPVVRPPLPLCKPTGISLGPGRRVFVMPDESGVGEALARRLRSLGVEVLDAAGALSGAPVHGVYWLPALDDEGDLKNMTLAAWRNAVDVRLKAFYRNMRALYDRVAPPGTFLISATRLGGRHGYGEDGATAPLGGAVTGFTKAYKRERPEALVKAVDFEGVSNTQQIADLLMDETLRDPGAVEIGYRRGQRWTIGLEARPAADGQPGLTLDHDSVFLVTGAAGSIVSAITVDLAAASGGTFYLLDIVPEPDAGNPDLTRFATDKEGLKRDLFARIQARGERATPALVEKELAALERAQAARAAIDAVRAAGGTAYYHSVNLTDGEAVEKVVADVRQRSGHIDVLLHAAGIDRSHALPDKDPREFDLVFDVKSEGLFHLLRAIGEMRLRTIVGFSSIAGRFGNGGQTDYSSANDLLCKITSSFRRTRPGTRAIAIDWTAWGGIGMATRGSIPKVMETAGIDLLPPEAGIPWIRRELTAGASDGEIVAAGGLGALLQEWDASGGVDASAALRGPMLGRMTRMDMDGNLSIETTLDPAAQPFLDDHRIDGTPVLPGVMGIEAFAEAALSMAPGWHVEAVEDVEFLAPFKFYRGQPRAIEVEARFRPERGGLAADCRLVGRRLLANQTEARVETHFTGRVRLAKQLREPADGPTPFAAQGAEVGAGDIYRIYFHGPAYQVLKRAWWDENGAVGEMAANLPAHHHPGDHPLVIAPRLIELCFQTAGLWEIAVQHRMGLPLHVDSVSLYRAPESADGPLFAVVTAHPAAESFDAWVVDRAGTRYLRVSGYRTVALRTDVDALDVIRAAAAVA